MKLTIQKANALGETTVIEADVDGPEDPQVANAFAISDGRFVEMNRRTMIASAMLQRYGPEVHGAYREITDVLFGIKAPTEEEVQRAVEETNAYRQKLKDEALARQLEENAANNGKPRLLPGGKR